jgi:deoxyribose-phosphate aldolase
LDKGDVDIQKIAGLIDHTLLRPDATRADIQKLAEEAKHHGFRTVCVNPYYIEAARDTLEGTGVEVCTVIGFPLGSTVTGAKVCEARGALSLGAHELDMVINIGAARSGDWEDVRNDIEEVISAAPGLVHKVIIETCYLSREEKVRAVETALEAGAGFIKTSTGMGTGGATVEDVRLIKEIVGARAGIKAAGGIKTLAQVLEMLGAGATRIGTSSGVSIMAEARRP